MQPIEAFLALTFRCNCRCAMCDVWQKPRAEEVEPSFYYRLPPTLRLVNLTGGEPFLRADLFEIAEAVTDRCPGVRLHISTNGLLTDRIVETTLRIRRRNRRVGVRVSVDGTPETHDRVRGIPGAFTRATETVRALRRAGVRDLGLAFTMTAGNEGDLIPVHDLARSLGVDLTTAVAHSAPAFFGVQEGRLPEPARASGALAVLRDRQLRALSPKQWLRAYFTDGQIDYLAGRPRRIRCGALREFFFLDPQGNVYPCPVLERPVGNLADGPLDALAAANPGALAAVDRCRRDCWMICTARPVMRRRLLSCLAWAARARWRLACAR